MLSMEVGCAPKYMPVFVHFRTDESDAKLWVICDTPVMFAWI